MYVSTTFRDEFHTVHTYHEHFLGNDCRRFISRRYIYVSCNGVKGVPPGVDLKFPRAACFHTPKRSPRPGRNSEQYTAVENTSIFDVTCIYFEVSVRQVAPWITFSQQPCTMNHQHIPPITATDPNTPAKKQKIDMNTKPKTSRLLPKNSIQNDGSYAVRVWVGFYARQYIRR